MKYFLLLLTLLSTTTFGANSSLNYGTLGIGATQLVNATGWSNSLTFTPNNFGTVTNNSFFWRQIGDSIEVYGSFAMGTGVASAAYIALPSGYVIDTTKLPSNAAGQTLGDATVALTASTTIGFGTGHEVLFYDGSTNNQIFFAEKTGSNAITKDNGSSIGSGSNVISVHFTVPIVGLSAAGGANNFVQSNGNGYKVDGVSVNSNCTSTPCTIATQTGSWVTSITRNSAGNYTVNIVSGEFASAPSCVITGSAGTAYINGAPTTTAFNFILENNGLVPTDGYFGVMCIGK